MDFSVRQGLNFQHFIQKIKLKLFRSEEEMQAIRTEEDFLAKMEKKRQKAALKAVQHLNFV